MRALLTALREGRLVELPETSKEKALEYLANLIEAVPDMPSVRELYEAMMARERAMNTGLGMGVACPHVRAPGGGELVCAVGWSPSGIDYASPDGKKVHLVLMYYIPDSQKNVYLKEISALAAAVRREGGIEPLATADTVATVRLRLLDWVSAAVEASLPTAAARMIRLEARHAAAEAPRLAGEPTALQVVDVRVLQQQGQRPLVLCQVAGLAATLEKDDGLAALIEQRAQFERDGYRLVFRSVTQYASGRALYDYQAIGRAALPAPAPPPKPA